MKKWQSAGLDTGSVFWLLWSALALVCHSGCRIAALAALGLFRSALTRVSFHAATAVLIVALLSGCAHPPPVVPPEPLEQVILGSYLPGTVKICIESPHRNSWFDIPAARGEAAPCVNLDALRHWIAHQMAADE